MITIHGARTFNPIKALLTAEELALDYKFVNIDFAKQENKTPEYLTMNPLGKVPVLDHGGKYVSESNTICRYLANISENKLYSDDPFTAAKIDGAIDTITQHIGRWMSAFFWEEVIKKQYFQKEPDPVVIAEAQKNLKNILPQIENLLANKTFFTGDNITIADTIGFAYFQLQEITSLNFNDYPNITRWYDAFNHRPSVANVNALF
ncbi:MAG: glutathione S-transferase family protein [Cellvibrionaceae bacterium]